MAHAEKGFRTLVFAVALFAGLTMPAFAQTQTVSPPSVPAATGATPQTAAQDYATERAAALEMRKNSEFLKSLPLFEDLNSKNSNDTLVLEGLAEALLARSVTQTDPTLANKDRMRARDIIEHARSLLAPASLQ